MRLIRSELPVVAHLVQLRLTAAHAVIVVTLNDRFRSPMHFSFSEIITMRYFSQILTG